MSRPVLTKTPVDHNGELIAVGSELTELTDQQAQALVDAEAADFVGDDGDKSESVTDPEAERMSLLSALLEQKVDDVEAVLPDLTVFDLDDLRALELGGKTRKGVIDAIDAEQAKRTAKPV